MGLDDGLRCETGRWGRRLCLMDEPALPQVSGRYRTEDEEPSSGLRSENVSTGSESTNVGAGREKETGPWANSPLPFSPIPLSRVPPSRPGILATLRPVVSHITLQHRHGVIDHSFERGKRVRDATR